MGQAVRNMAFDGITRPQGRRRDYIQERREFVTPAKAKKWLGLNTDNYRSMSKANVQNLRRAIELGLFQQGACGAISFHEEGHLADGQHRLMAIVLANIGAWLTIRDGLTDGDVLALDSGKRRTAVNRIKQLDSFSKPSIVAPVSRFMLLGLTRGFQAAVSGRDGAGDAMQISFCIKEREALEFATATMTSRKARFDGNSSLHFLRAIAALDYADQVDEFTELFVTGAGLPSRSPILALREEFIRARQMAQQDRQKSDFREFFHPLMFLAWNKWLEKKQAKKLRVPSKALVVPTGWDSWVPKALEYQTETDRQEG